MDELTTYDDVNNAWGGMMLPPVTTAESVAIFRKLARRFGEKRARGCPWSRSRSYAAPRGTDTTKPRGNGLPRMVHDASHFVFRRLHPTFKTHSAAHAALELAMIQHVIAKGWHLPKSPPAKPTRDDTLAAEFAKVEAHIKRWETKAKRAATALRKLNRKRANLQRRIAET